MSKPHYLKDPVAPVIDQLLGAAECVPALRDYVKGLQTELGDARQSIIDLQGANAAYVRANSKLLAEARAAELTAQGYKTLAEKAPDWHEALQVAHRHLDMAALRVSHPKDAAIIEAATQCTADQPPAEPAEAAPEITQLCPKCTTGWTARELLPCPECGYTFPSRPDDAPETEEMRLLTALVSVRPGCATFDRLMREATAFIAREKLQDDCQHCGGHPGGVDGKGTPCPACGSPGLHRSDCAANSRTARF